MTNLQRPKVTIVTPSLDQGHYIEASIRSVLNQSYKNVEYIICDGGSGDNTLEIIRRYQQHIHYWRSAKDGGQSAAVREGLQRSTGDIVGWLNADDVYMPDILETVVEVFLEHPDIDVLYGDTQIIGPDGETIRQMKTVPFCKWGFLTNAFSLYQPSVFWRRAIYDRTDGINVQENLAMDQDLWLQFYQQGAKFQHLSKILSGFRVHKESKTMRYGSELGRAYSAVRDRLIGINMSAYRYRLIRSIMRLRTLFYHVQLGNLGYVIHDVGKSYDQIHSGLAVR